MMVLGEGGGLVVVMVVVPLRGGLHRLSGIGGGELLLPPCLGGGVARAPCLGGGAPCF